MKNIEVNIKSPKYYENGEVSNNWEDIYKAQKKAKEMGIPESAYGIIEIPSIGLDLPIYHGANEYTLSLGAATYFYDDKLSDGNLVLVGHNTPYEGILFTSLSNIQAESVITVRTGEGTVRYSVKNISVISNAVELNENGVPLDNWLKKPKNGEKAKISLITCINWQNSTQRLLVEGEIM